MGDPATTKVAPLPGWDGLALHQAVHATVRWLTSRSQPDLDTGQHVVVVHHSARPRTAPTSPGLS
jgi:hypothetical protein